MAVTWMCLAKLSRKTKVLFLLGIVILLLLLRNNLRTTEVDGPEPIFQRNFTRIRNSRGEFCLASYNILTDEAIKNHPNRYLPLPPDEKLKGPNPESSRRHTQLMKELQWLESDIISLQEVEQWYFEVLVKEFLFWNFEGVFDPHYKNRNGVATFWNTKRFKFVNSLTYGFSELLGKLYDLKLFKNSTKPNERIAKFTVLTELKTEKILVVGNTHLMFGQWKEPDLQALQVSLFLQQLHKVVSELGGKVGNQPPWLISGDFNMYPYFPTYELVSTGKVSEENLQKLNPNKYKYPQVFERNMEEDGESVVLKNCRQHLSHPLRDIKSAYKSVLGHEPPLTHYQIDKNFPELYGFDIMKGTLDYIWYSSDGLHVNAVLEPVREDIIKPLVACPNKFFPSDHLSLKACFSFRN